jgi:hypothetical protein
MLDSMVKCVCVSYMDLRSNGCFVANATNFY